MRWQIRRYVPPAARAWLTGVPGTHAERNFPWSSAASSSSSGLAIFFFFFSRVGVRDREAVVCLGEFRIEGELGEMRLFWGLILWIGVEEV